MKNSFFVLVLCCGLLGACGGKQKNARLGQNYYKLAMLELTDEARGEQSYKKALRYIDQALAQDKKPDYLALKATLLFKLGQEEESCVCFKKALAVGDDLGLRAEILNNYACLCAHMNKLDEASKIWQSLEYNKDYLTPEVACINQGKVAIGLKQYEQAKTHFLRAIAIDPAYLDAHYYVALTAHVMCNQALAQQSIRTVLFLEPKHQGALELARQLGISQ